MKPNQQPVKKSHRTVWYMAGMAVLLITNLVSAVMLYNKMLIDEQAMAEVYPLLSPHLDETRMDDLITNVQPLRNSLRELTNDRSAATIGIYVEMLSSGANISINNDTRLWPASLAKLPVALAAMGKVERGEWRLENELLLTQDDVNEGWGDLAGQPIGSRLTIEFLIKKLLHDSDNTARRILTRNMSENDMQALIDATGLEELFSEEGKITAKEYSRMFRVLYYSSYLSPENSQKLLQWMAETPYDDYLAQGIPQHVPFAHKFGENRESNVFADSGIVYVKNRPYMITVLVNYPGVNWQDAKVLALQEMKEISTAAYEYVSKY